MSNDLVNLDNKELRDKLNKSKDPAEIEQIVQLFDLNLRKKEVIRADILSELQDKIAAQVEKRIDKNSDSFSNKDLLDYLNSIQNIISKTKDQSQINTQSIAIQNNILVQDSSEELSKDSRDKIADLIKNFLSNNSQEDIIDINQDKGE